MSHVDGETEGKAVVIAFANEVKGKTGKLSKLQQLRDTYTNGAGSVLITGPSAQGIGAEVALSLATSEPKHIILAGRSEAKIKPVFDQIKSINPEVQVTFVPLDLSDNASVRRAADTINNTIETLDVLVNNAGVMAIKTYTTSVDGFEMHFASNHLGHFLLTNLLMDKIIAAKGVVINVTSTGYTLAEVNFEDPNFEVCLSYCLSVTHLELQCADIGIGREDLQPMDRLCTIQDSQHPLLRQT